MVMRIQVGMVTFGNLNYSKLAIDSLYASTDIPIELVIIVGKPGDLETQKWAKSIGATVITHNINKGFPASLNDIYDIFWVGKDSRDPILILGNDVVVYPLAVDRLLNYYHLTKCDWVSSQQLYTPKKYCELFPSYRSYFSDDFSAVEGFDYRWLLKDYIYQKEIPTDVQEILVHDLTTYNQVGDSHNLCLFSRNLFSKIGYVDVNFFPAYFEDNDYARRAQLANLKMVQLVSSHYFHFWSRTIYEENMKKTNDKYFPKNKKYYIKKWGGVPGQEKITTPENIVSRDYEETVLDYWRNV